MKAQGEHSSWSAAQVSADLPRAAQGGFGERRGAKVVLLYPAWEVLGL